MHKTKDQIWEEMRRDGTTVYGKPIFHAFLEVAEKIEERHFDALKGRERALPNAELRLVWAATPQEAKRAVADGADRTHWALKMAAARGHLGVVEYLLDTFNPDDAKVQRKEALWYASMSGRLDVVRHLVEKGDTPLDMALYAAAGKGHAEIVKYLVDAGAHGVEEAIAMAVHEDETEIVKLLIDRANPESPALGKAIDYAIERGNKESLSALLDKASSIDIHALSFAVDRGNFDIVKMLVEKGAPGKDQALVEAADFGDLEMVKFLVEKGAESLDEAVTAAAHRGNLEIVKYLVERGAEELDVALLWAASRGDLEMVKFLVGSGAGNIQAARNKSKNEKVREYLRSVM